MIPYDQLCAALEAYAARTRGQEPPSRSPSSSYQPQANPAYDPPTTEVQMPDDPQASLRSRMTDEEGTHMDGMPESPQPVYDDKSNELDIGDVLSDEEAN